MNTINLNQEWSFVTTETHKEKPNKANLLKRESLFALEILLGKIELTASPHELNFLKKNYLALKKLY